MVLVGVSITVYCVRKYKKRKPQDGSRHPSPGSMGLQAINAQLHVPPEVVEEGNSVLNGNGIPAPPASIIPGTDTMSVASEILPKPEQCTDHEQGTPCNNHPTSTSDELSLRSAKSEEIDFDQEVPSAPTADLSRNQF